MTYLSTIEQDAGKSIHILRSNIRQTSTAIGIFQEAIEDGLACLFLKFVISHHQVNPIENGIIEVLDQISGQESDAVVILQFAKKDRHQAISFQGEFDILSV